VLVVDIRRDPSLLSDHREDLSTAPGAVVPHSRCKPGRDVFASDRLEGLAAAARHHDAGCLRKSFSFFGRFERDIWLRKGRQALIPKNRAAVVALRYFAFAFISRSYWSCLCVRMGRYLSDDEQDARGSESDLRISPEILRILTGFRVIRGSGQRMPVVPW